MLERTFALVSCDSKSLSLQLMKMMLYCFIRSRSPSRVLNWPSTPGVPPMSDLMPL
jgi:hypothetical protein